MIISFQQKFVQKIIDGEKVQTIRENKKGHYKTGIKFQMYAPNRPDRGGKFFGTAIPYLFAAIEINIHYRSVWHGGLDKAIFEAKDAKKLEQFAKEDGFDNADDMFAFFEPRAVNGVFRGVLMHWGDTFVPVPTSEVQS